MRNWTITCPAMLLKGNEDRLIGNKWYIIKSKDRNFTCYGQASVIYRECQQEKVFYVFNYNGIIEVLTVEYIVHLYPEATVELVEIMNITLSSKNAYRDQTLNFSADIMNR